jgi:hypothetical protein
MLNHNNAKWYFKNWNCSKRANITVLLVKYFELCVLREKLLFAITDTHTAISIDDMLKSFPGLCQFRFQYINP